MNARHELSILYGDNIDSDDIDYLPSIQSTEDDSSILHTFTPFCHSSNPKQSSCLTLVSMTTFINAVCIAISFPNRTHKKKSANIINFPLRYFPPRDVAEKGIDCVRARWVREQNGL